MPDNKKIKIGIIGGSGYGGSELLRILLFHPLAEIKFVSANEKAGKRVDEVHKNLKSFTDISFVQMPTRDEFATAFAEIDLIFIALPHGYAINIVPDLPNHLKVIDLSGDFRIDDAETFTKFYDLDHGSKEWQDKFVYGLTENNHDQIKNAQYIANPGCFATASLLALSPLVAAKLISGKVVIDAKTGSSGSGINPAQNTHHPQRMNSFYAYKPFTHQHLPEMQQHLNSISEFENNFVFMTHSMPVARGIFASCYLTTTVGITNEDLKNLYSNYYKKARFVRIVDGSPDINWVKNTNFCDISVYSNGSEIVVFSAIDNLVKGAAGQAVQNMNLMFGLDETTGLLFTGSNP